MDGKLQPCYWDRQQTSDSQLKDCGIDDSIREHESAHLFQYYFLRDVSIPESDKGGKGDFALLNATNIQKAFCWELEEGKTKDQRIGALLEWSAWRIWPSTCA